MIFLSLRWGDFEKDYLNHPSRVTMYYLILHEFFDINIVGFKEIWSMYDLNRYSKSISDFYDTNSQSSKLCNQQLG